MVLQPLQPVQMVSHYPKSRVLQSHHCAFQANQQNARVSWISPGEIKPNQE